MIYTIGRGYKEAIAQGGNVRVELHDALTGDLVWSDVAQNKVPLVGRNLIRDVLIGDTALTGQPPSHIAIGTGSSSPADTDTQLGNEVYRSVITQKSISASTIIWKFFVPANAANGYTLSEACIVNSSGLVPVMPILSRVTHTPFAKTPNITVTYSWTHTISQST